MERHPNQEALCSQMVVYLLSASALDARDLETLLKNIFSPILQKEVQMYGTGFIASAYREGELNAQKEAEKAKLAAIQLNTRTTMMRLWKKSFAIELIADVVQLCAFFCIYIIFNWLIFNKLRFKLGIFVVEGLDLYEWSWGQESYKMQSSESKFGAYMSCKGGS